ncbi:hypothetical protein [Agromyces ramosus]|uniref:Anti-sigma-K factor rskA n=1 Tax=Agromyces ramosus TaxID=33879 RepID=A0ABU0R988_9MICO|nr:hypothetical protein [Agromyces ramosus]MDQ0894327.1 hypothetical protein [Agromyces ramosus]
MNHRDDEVARLQRLVYGADSTADERRRAAEELHELAQATDAAARPSPGSADIADSAGGTGSTDGGATPAHAAASSPTADVDDPPAPGAEAGFGRRLAIRVGVAGGAAALVLGIVAGWQLSQLDGGDVADADALTAPTESAGPRLQADALAAMPVAAETLAARVFLRAAVPEDRPDLPGLREGAGMVPGNGPREFRLLATRADGIRFFAARDVDELCLFYVTPVSGPEGVTASGTCTRGGRFPNEGLRLSGSGSSGTESVDATWRPDGSLQIGVITGAPPGE